MPGKFRKMIFAMIGVILLLDIVAIIDYVDSSKSSPPPPTPIPWTAAPCPPVPCLINSTCYNSVDPRCFSIPPPRCPNTTNGNYDIW